MTDGSRVHFEIRMGWVMGFEPTYVGITIRCVNHFATPTRRGDRDITRNYSFVNIRARALSKIFQYPIFDRKRQRLFGSPGFAILRQTYKHIEAVSLGNRLIDERRPL